MVVTAVFMVTLDNLVVTTALAGIRAGIGASLAQLEWVVNAYTVTFAALMMLSAGIAGRFGHRRVWLIGLAVFTGFSGAAAVAPTADLLIAARAAQGMGAAVVLPLSLTLLAAAFPADGRNLALGIWSAVSGLGVAVGPLVGGALVSIGSWQTIFWLNVPIGAALMLAAVWAVPRRGVEPRRIDVLGAVLVTAGLLGVVGALVGTQHASWSAPAILVPLLGGMGLLVAFVRWEARASDPLLPLRFFTDRGFVAVNLVNLGMYFGMFGAIFLLAPFLQIVLGDDPFRAGLRILPWTLMPLLVSPFVGMVTDRWGPRTLVGIGMAAQAVALGWIAGTVTAQMSFLGLVGPCVLGGVGMAMVYPPVAAVVLDAVEPGAVTQASAAMNSIREAGGALGIGVLTALFTTAGGSLTAGGYLGGLRVALVVAASAVALGAVAAYRLPGPRASVRGATSVAFQQLSPAATTPQSRP